VICDTGPVPELFFWYCPRLPRGLLLIGLFLFYLLCYFVVIYFNTALITCARIHLTKGNPVFTDGIRNANAHLIPIFI